MIFKFIIGIILVGSLAGCTTTKQKPSTVNQLQIRVVQIENQLDVQDQDISELQSDIEDLMEQVKHTAKSVKSLNIPQQTVQAPPTKAPKSSRQGILRIPVTPQEVQIALQNAGYYTGAIDGKLGSGSQKAIRDFQTDHDLESDGIIGKKTWTELKNYLE